MGVGREFDQVDSVTSIPEPAIPRRRTSFGDSDVVKVDHVDYWSSRFYIGLRADLGPLCSRSPVLEVNAAALLASAFSERYTDQFAMNRKDRCRGFRNSVVQVAAPAAAYVILQQPARRRRRLRPGTQPGGTTCKANFGGRDYPMMGADRRPVFERCRIRKEGARRFFVVSINGSLFRSAPITASADVQALTGVGAPARQEHTIVHRRLAKLACCPVGSA